MKTKYTHCILALLIAVSLAAGGCGTGAGSKSNQNVAVDPNLVIPEGPQAKLLREGNSVKGAVQNDCDNSIVLESLNSQFPVVSATGTPL